MSLIHPLDSHVLGKCLRSTESSEVYAATREDGLNVILKAYAGDSSSDPRSRAHREFEAMRQVAGPGIPAALELLLDGSVPVLVLQRVPGVTLTEWVGIGVPAPGAFLEMALAVTDALARVHDARLMHRDVTPHNVMVDPEALGCHLIDFGLARPLGSASQLSEGRPEIQSLAGTLPYISPEQTGRMGRGVDSRSDLYSLGATFYFALTGRPPFEGTDPLALIHAHMAKMPPAPSDLRPQLPATLSRIVMKLLQKAPEARYQTARALHRDLDECRTQLRQNGTIESDFPLGTADAPYRPLFATKLYGRETEIEALEAAYARARGGSSTMLVLQGSPGVGKSALVHQLRTPVAQSNGYLALGKFDLYRRDVHLLGFVQAFESLIQQILTESDAQLAGWRRELLAGLGPSAGVLVELIPDLGFVLGDVPPVPALGPAQTRVRLNLAVQRFVHALAAPEHPLVLFLDDLQWADAGSRDLIQELVPAVRDRALLLLCSYRDTEVDASHPFARLVRELEERGIPIQSIALRPLSEEACAHMLAHALGRKPAETRRLAACVGRKTGHTPLLIQQFVYHMYDLGLIRFQMPAGWSWDDAALDEAGIPDDAVGLMSAKIARLAAPVAAVLQLASCVGDAFDLDTLSELTDQPRAELESSLFTLCDEGLIAPSRAGFRFVHDRIREAAQALLSAEERARLHHEAARLLLERTAPEALSERAVEIADHLNLALERLDAAEQLRAIEVHLLAGKAALRAGAAATASHYLSAGRALFRDTHWESHAQLGFDLFLQAAESAYQMGEAELAVELLARLDARPWPRLQAGQIAVKMVATRILMRPGKVELPFVLASLRRFGVRWPAYPSWIRTYVAVLRAEWSLRGSLQLPPPAGADLAYWLPPLLLMAAGGSPMSNTTIRLTTLSACFAVRKLRRYGSAPGASYVLAGFAFTRLGFVKHLRGAERYAKAALEWSERDTHPMLSARTEAGIYAYLLSWTRPRRSILEGLRRAAERCREVGDLEWAGYASYERAHLAALAGEPLANVAADYEAIAPLGNFADDPQARILALLQRPLPDRETLAREIAAIGAILQRNERARQNRYVFWLEVLYFIGCADEAYATSEHIASWISEVGSSNPQVGDFLFLRGVMAAERGGCARARERRSHARVLRRCLRQLRVFARDGPDFVHMAQALSAERFRLSGRTQDALAQYRTATERALRQGYRHHAALLHERRAGLLHETRRTTEAASAVRQAIGLYEAWGALSKVEALRAAADTL